MKLDKQTYTLFVKRARAAYTDKTDDELALDLIRLAERPGDFQRYEKEAILYIAAIRIRKRSAV